MTPSTVYFAGITQALNWAKRFLKEAGMIAADSPNWNVNHLILDVPSFRKGDPLCDNGNLDTLLEALPHSIIVWGGNLNHPRLNAFRTIDFLKDETYLVENAAITADCTTDVIAPLLKDVWQKQNILIIGWGRIGKCLAQNLHALGCAVTVSARSEADIRHLTHLGYPVIPTAQVHQYAKKFSVIINTVPAPVLSAIETDESNCIKIDLASVKGIEGEDVVWARGLPGKYAPERSGRLIADTFLRLWKEERI